MARTITPYNEIFSIGDHIILGLHDDDIFEGDFIQGGKDRIDLVNTKQHNNPNDVLSGTYSLYRTEIREICQLKLSSIDQHKTVSYGLKIIDMSREEYDRLRSLTKNIICLEKADKRYFDAIESLKNADSIGIVSLGMDQSRVDTLKILTVCTRLEVYLFDMDEIKNKKIYPELKEILESEFICKIMYNAGPLVDILSRNYKVFCNNIFDPQVVDLIYQKNVSIGLKYPDIEPRSLAECLVSYLNFPVSFLKDALAISRKKWRERPLKNEYKIFAAQLCVYLIPLTKTLRQKLFCSVYKAVDNVHMYYHQLSDDQYKKQVKDSTVNADIEKLIPSLIQKSVSDSS